MGTPLANETLEQRIERRRRERERELSGTAGPDPLVRLLEQRRAERRAEQGRARVRAPDFVAEAAERLKPAAAASTRVDIPPPPSELGVNLAPQEPSQPPEPRRPSPELLAATRRAVEQPMRADVLAEPPKPAEPRPSLGEFVSKIAESAPGPVGSAMRIGAGRPRGEAERGFRAGLEAIPESVASTVETVAGATGLEDVAAKARQVREEERPKPRRPRVGSLQDIRDVDDAVDWALYAGGQGIASSLAPLATATIGTLLGGPIGGVVGATAGSYAQNVGELRQELERAGVTDTDKLEKLTLAGAVPMALLDAVVPARIAGGAVRRQVVRRLAQRLVRVAETGVLEFATEGAQSGIAKGIVSGETDQPFLTRENLLGILDEAAAGGVTGLALGAGGAAATRGEPTDVGAGATIETRGGAPAEPAVVTPEELTTPGVLPVNAPPGSVGE